MISKYFPTRENRAQIPHLELGFLEEPGREQVWTALRLLRQPAPLAPGRARGLRSPRWLGALPTSPSASTGSVSCLRDAT